MLNRATFIVLCAAAILANPSVGSSAKSSLFLAEVDDDVTPGSPPQGGERPYTDPRGGRIWLRPGLIITDADVGGAEVTFDHWTHEPALLVRLSPQGTLLLAQYTAAHIGRRVALVLDHRVICALVIMDAIPGGVMQIIGGFDEKSAKALALRIEQLVGEQHRRGAS